VPTGEASDLNQPIPSFWGGGGGEGVVIEKLTTAETEIGTALVEYKQMDATFHNLFISVRRFTCFRRFFRPSS